MKSLTEDLIKVIAQHSTSDESIERLFCRWSPGEDTEPVPIFPGEDGQTLTRRLSGYTDWSDVVSYEILLCKLAIMVHDPLEEFKFSREGLSDVASAVPKEVWRLISQRGGINQNFRTVYQSFLQERLL